ncbi:MAG TPA: RES family NAD+ phosphorylase [Burkholderiales bacterium]|nr:RES family NAD+ phosphorylase [Burkholderiales bacterium]
MFENLIHQVADYHGDLVRNIQTIRVSQDLFDDLSANRADQAVAIAAEAAGRIASEAPLITRPFDYGTVITFPFANFNGQGTRFSDGLRYGVWYGSLELETTVYETVVHRHRFLMDSFPSMNREIRGERRVFQVGCDAILIDLRGKEAVEGRLIERTSYAYTQPLGAYLQAQGTNGLLVKSARCEGWNAAIFRAQALSRVRDLCHLTYLMNPTQDTATIERTPGETWLRIKIPL